MGKSNNLLCGILILLCCAVAAFAQGRGVAVTIDDVPFMQGSLAEMKLVNEKLLSKLKAENVPAVGFVNEGKLRRNGEIEERTAILQMWLDAGVELGNHTYSHISLDQNPIESYQRDVINGEKVTSRLLAQKRIKLRYFRHPNLRTGKTI